jgi:hypothetical protein
MQTLTLNECDAFSDQSVAAAGYPTIATNASCAASSPSTPNMNAAFNAYAAGCTGGVGALCGSGVCAKAASHYCVYQMGTPTCPSGFPTSTALFGGIDDTFTCSCTCSMATPPSCAPVATFYSDNCTKSVGSVSFDGPSTACGELGASVATTVKMTSAGNASGGSCNPTGVGILSGDARGKNPVTVCCTN